MGHAGGICQFCLSRSQIPRCPQCGEVAKGKLDTICARCGASLHPERGVVTTRRRRYARKITDNPIPTVLLAVLLVVVVVVFLGQIIRTDDTTPEMSAFTQALRETSQAPPTPYGPQLNRSGDAAVQVAESLTDRGLSVRIRVGATDHAISSITEVTDAWVMVETTSRRWVAGDPLIGAVISPQEKPYYYRGWDFATTAQFNDFMSRFSLYKQKKATYDAANATYQRQMSSGADQSILDTQMALLQVANAEEQAALDQLHQLVRDQSSLIII
ncbi:hypothetical protein Mpal_1057 [Methanosphaerula palustris E1-9c]|uniref:Uncharacterized protein n=2 Tax=Methanosphaerula palustris TaxID=475088 RepID=B8GGZ9_METPE|nr:hypothetical protein Mpal_1057 [Methanosphaerula palustris E1-9c]